MNTCKKKLLITGTNGFIGQKLLEQFAYIDTIQLIAVSKSNNQLSLSSNTLFIQVDLTDQVALKTLFLTYQPDIVIHTAALTVPDACETNKEEAYLQNVLVVENLLAICRQIQAFFVHFSTDFVFDGVKGLYEETDLPNPISYYGFTKLEAEKRVLQYPHDFAIIRTCLVYGIADYMNKSNIVLWVKENLEKNKPIRVVNDQVRTPTLVDDLAAITRKIALEKHTGIWHISGKEVLTPYQMALSLASFFELATTLISPTNATEFIEVAKRPLKTGFTITKAEHLLNYSPHSFLEGLQAIKNKITDKNLI